MAKMVGLSRNLKMQWLNKTVELVNEGLTEKEVKESLNEYLSYPSSVRYHAYRHYNLSNKYLRQFHFFDKLPKCYCRSGDHPMNKQKRIRYSMPGE